MTKPSLLAAALAALAISSAPAAQPAPRTFTLPVDAGVTALTVEVSGKGRVCGPARVLDSNGRVLISLAAGQCVSADR